MVYIPVSTLDVTFDTAGLARFEEWLTRYAVDPATIAARLS